MNARNQIPGPEHLRAIGVESADAIAKFFALPT